MSTYASYIIHLQPVDFIVAVQLLYTMNINGIQFTFIATALKYMNLKYDVRNAKHFESFCENDASLAFIVIDKIYPLPTHLISQRDSMWANRVTM